jgi:simple sugar transport system permease protein
MSLSSLFKSRLGLAALAVVIAVVIAFLISSRVFGGSIEQMLATPGYGIVLFINALVGISVALFVVELRRNAVRVLVTVAIALALGYVITVIFNLDAANRFTQGDFKVTLLSEAEAPATEDMDLEYGRTRSGKFNDPAEKVPLTETAYTFAGQAGDDITILAFAANRRSQVDVQVELRDEIGATLAQATAATEEQLVAYEDLVTGNDAVIEHFTLPADGIYVIRALPEPVGADIVLREAINDTSTAYNALLLGPLSRVNRWAFWVQESVTLIMLGLAISVVFTARQFSLGAEGQLILGALISGYLALLLKGWSPFIVVPLALLSAAAVGFFWGLLPGALKAYLGANELVATLMLNTVAVQFFELVLNFQLKPAEAGGLFSDWIRTDFLFAPILEGTGVTTGLFMMLVITVLVWLLIRRTPLGYEIRIIGANIKFADYGGINTRRTIMLSMALSGLVAGLAGAHLALGIQGRLAAGLSAGLAFEGVVVALLARNNPLVVTFTGILYAYLRVGARFMESDTDVSFEVVRVIQAVIILLITAEGLLAFFQQQRMRQRGTATLETSPGDSAPKQALAAEE